MKRCSLKKILFILTGLLVCFHTNLRADSFKPLDVNILLTYAAEKNPLLQYPRQKSTVGIIPYTCKNNDIYIFLGRENINSTKKDRGTFSDFGGNTYSDATILENLLRELKEETMGKMILLEKEVLEKGLLLYKISTAGREIFYVFYPISQKDFEVTQTLNIERAKAQPQLYPSSYLEKDQFKWVRLKDLQNAFLNVSSYSAPICVQDIDGHREFITLRPFFIKDVLKHPAFKDLVDFMRC